MERTVFRLTINMGNEMMLWTTDIATALRKVAKRLDDGETAAAIRDLYGNTVGAFAIADEEVEEE